MAIENRTFWPLCDSQNQLQLFVYFTDTTYNIFFFSIPVPIPKTSLGGSETKVNYQHARNATFLEKIGHRIVNGFQKVQDTVLGVFDPILETGGNFLGLEDDNNEIGKKF